MKQHLLLGLLRISMGWIFLWAFLDKLFGLGFATDPQGSWLSGASPTFGFLTHGTQGPLQTLFAMMAGNMLVDWLYMLGMLGVGVALILGIGMRIAAVSGSLIMGLIYLSVLPPENNPVIDHHIIYIFVLLLLLKYNSGDVLGLGKWWKKTTLVKNFPYLS